MTCAIKKYVYILGSKKKTHVLLGCTMCKKITRKPFVQLKPIVLIMNLGTRRTSAENATLETGSGLQWAFATYAKVFLRKLY